MDIVSVDGRCFYSSKLRLQEGNHASCVVLSAFRNGVEI